MSASAALPIVATPGGDRVEPFVQLGEPEVHPEPNIEIAARTHSEAGQKFLEERGVNRAFMGERELALSMAHYALMRMGQTDDQADDTVDAMRRMTGTNIKAISRDEIPPVEPPTGPVLPHAS